MEEDFLEETKGREIDLFVCSDGEAILGIGDQGVGVRSHIDYQGKIKFLTVFGRRVLG
jgi:malic enzyme